MSDETCICDFAGHKYEDTGGCLEICVECQDERWADPCPWCGQEASMSAPEPNSMKVLRHATRALGLDLSEKRLKHLHFDAWEEIKREADAKLAGQRPPGPPNPPEPPLERPVA